MGSDWRQRRDSGFHPGSGRGGGRGGGGGGHASGWSAGWGGHRWCFGSFLSASIGGWSQLGGGLNGFGFAGGRGGRDTKSQGPQKQQQHQHQQHGQGDADRDLERGANNCARVKSNDKDSGLVSESGSWAEKEEMCRRSEETIGLPCAQEGLYPDSLVKASVAWKKPVRVGPELRNEESTTCFFNATLQVLSYLPPLAQHLLETKYSPGLFPDSSVKTSVRWKKPVRVG